LNIGFDEYIFNQIKKYYTEIINKNSYFTNDFNINLKIICIEKNYLILSNKSFEYGSIFTTHYNIYPNRYFIGLQFNTMSINYEICGMIGYFDSIGIMKKKIFFTIFLVLTMEEMGALIHLKQFFIIEL
jgi:hypothetical protein